MNENLIIQKARTKDFDIIFNIEEMSYKDPWPREVFIMDFLFNSSAHYYVAKINDCTAGFLGIWDEENKIHVINVTVHPQYRRKGIGRHLVAFAINYAKEKGKKEIYLEVRKTNIFAIKLYESMGFFERERIANYYQDGEEGIRMTLCLNDKR